MPAASQRGRGAVEAAGSDGAGRGLMDTALRREVGGILHSSIPPSSEEVAFQGQTPATRQSL